MNALARARAGLRRLLGSGLDSIAVRGARRLPERRSYELTKEEIATICAAHVQDRTVSVKARIDLATAVNAAWCAIARARRFDYRTVQPVEGRFPLFTAIPLPDDERDGGVIILNPR